MYPYFRMVKEIVRQNFLKTIQLSEVHTYYTLCWPVDLDPWKELNNGRTLTLYDLGRISHLIRSGLKNKIMAKGWRFCNNDIKSWVNIIFNMDYLQSNSKIKSAS